jgi:hypothetical protein
LILLNRGHENILAAGTDNFRPAQCRPRTESRKTDEWVDLRWFAVGEQAAPGGPATRATGLP